MAPRGNPRTDLLYHAIRTKLGATGATSSAGSVPGPVGPAGPKGVTWRGAWVADFGYSVGDLVTSSDATFICLVDHLSVFGAPPLGGDSYWAELAVGYLLVSGARPMAGNLDMNHNDIVDVANADIEGTATIGEDAVFTEGVGGAKITNPRVISMTGAEADSEGRIEGVNALKFNAVTPADEVGRVSWSALEGTLVVCMESGS